MIQVNGEEHSSRLIIILFVCHLWLICATFQNDSYARTRRSFSTNQLVFFLILEKILNRFICLFFFLFLVKYNDQFIWYHQQDQGPRNSSLGRMIFIMQLLLLLRSTHAVIRHSRLEEKKRKRKRKKKEKRETSLIFRKE